MEKGKYSIYLVILSNSKRDLNQINDSSLFAEYNDFKSALEMFKSLKFAYSLKSSQGYGLELYGRDSETLLRQYYNEY